MLDEDELVNDVKKIRKPPQKSTIVFYLNTFGDSINKHRGVKLTEPARPFTRYLKGSKVGLFLV